MKTTLSITSMSLKLTTNCDACGALFTFHSNNVADIDGRRWPTRCEPCRVEPLPVAQVVPKKRRGKR